MVATLKRLGWSVLRLSVSDGPDLAIARAGRTVLVEVKSGTKKLKPGQVQWHQDWPGETAVVRSVQDAVEMR